MGLRENSRVKEQTADDLYDTYCSTNTISLIESKRISLARHVTGMRNGRNMYQNLVVTRKGKGSLEDLT